MEEKQKKKLDDYTIIYDPSDYPDYSDAYFIYAEIDGRVLSDDEVEQLNNDRELVYEKVLEQIYG